MTLREQAIFIASAFIITAEGLKLRAYLDGGGVWTIGVGHTGPEVKRGQVITRQEAMRLLDKDMAWAVKCVFAYARDGMTPHKYAALISLCFNIGETAFKNSTLFKRLNSNRLSEVPAQFMRWVFDNGEKVDGLVNRRTAEVKLWNTPA